MGKRINKSRQNTKIRSTGVTELDDKWFTTYMAEIHGTLGRISEAGGKDMEDIRDRTRKACLTK